MSTIINTALTNIKPNDILEVRKIGTRVRPSFHMIGNGTMNRHGIQSICMIQVTGKATSAGRFVITEMAKIYTWECDDGVVAVPMNLFTNSQQVTWRKGFKELKEQGYITRIKRGYYLLNPNMLVPPDYDKSLALWDIATQTKKD